MGESRTEVDTSNLRELQSLLTRLATNDEQGDGLASFAAPYLAHAVDEELQGLDAGTVAAIVLGHWRFARMRVPGHALVRVFNPALAEHGWQGEHTVLEIVTDDMPFLVDSVTLALNRQELTIHRLLHPVISLTRGPDGDLLSSSEHGKPESWMHLHIDPLANSAQMQRLVEQITHVLADVRKVVEDWQPMRERLLSLAGGADLGHGAIPVDQLAEIRAFLHWVADDHFTFLGYRAYELRTQGQEQLLCTQRDSGLGLLRQLDASVNCRNLSSLPAEQRAFVFADQVLVLSKTTAVSQVHRPGHMDYIGIKRYAPDGTLLGEHRFLGLYSSAAYNALPADIPLLRQKRAAVVALTGFSPGSHDAKLIEHVLDTYPRDELFQTEIAELTGICQAIVRMRDRRRLRLFMRKDPFGRFVTCLVFVPRDRYTTETRLKIQQILVDALGGQDVEFSTRFSASVLARVRLTIFTPAGISVHAPLEQLEQQLRDALLSWEEQLALALQQACGGQRGRHLMNVYQGAFGPQYQADFSAHEAVSDLLRLDALGPDLPGQLHLQGVTRKGQPELLLKVYGLEQTVSLSDAIPLLENMGLHVKAAHPYEVRPHDGRALWMLNFELLETSQIRANADQVREIFHQAVIQVWLGRADNDGFNRLVLAAGLNWREVGLLRAVCKYLLQIQMPFSQVYVEQVLLEHAQIAASLIRLFLLRFDPSRAGERAQHYSGARAKLDESLDAVTSLDADRILRLYASVLDAMLRTNYFQLAADGQPKDYLSFKLEARRIAQVPAPRPMFEIFVYSPRVEAVHLRGGPVARGGLRWSDRMEDYRTEVLGLMKAQMVKNAVIVPVGSKGGFIVKRMPEQADAVRQEVVECYQIMIRGLLDLTDNRIGEQIVPPPNLVRHDQDDPYLVVAADKGTASFSDLANAVAAEYDFWLGDAFASGGSAGYDHKKMGITARGAWESVTRHFQNLGVDIARQSFSVVGIGDMSGDVFGNGMLLARQARLLAAFDHRHIFLDPSPDPEKSHAERSRLFGLPRSSWADYDPGLISEGGGVFSRTMKSIPLSEQVRAMLDVQQTHLSPPELIHAILRAPVDLLWNGGIGTYVKAHDETHAQVGDRANEAVRIDGRELRARVVGEGGNLGFTQRGRIEAARAGVLILTDAIDNAGGVNCSDHEVNIKILLEQAIRAGQLQREQRDQLLREMTADVADLVLHENHAQPLTIAIELARGAEAMAEHAAMIRALERAGNLNRALEFLPDDQELATREAAGQGLFGPELAVLLAYGKITLFDALLQSDIPEDGYLDTRLAAYFPVQLRVPFGAAIATHPLRRQLICTVLANEMLDCMGPAFVHWVGEQTGKSAGQIARAYLCAHEIFDVAKLHAGIQALTGRVPTSLQYRLLGRVSDLQRHACVWLLRMHADPLPIADTVATLRAFIKQVEAQLPQLLSAAEQAGLLQEVEAYQNDGLPHELAGQLAQLDWLYLALDVSAICGLTGRGAEQAPKVASLYFGLFSELGLAWLRAAITRLPAIGQWQQRASAALLDRLFRVARQLSAGLLESIDTYPASSDAPSGPLQGLGQAERATVDRCRQTLAQLQEAPALDLAMLTVALSDLEALDLRPTARI